MEIKSMITAIISAVVALIIVVVVAIPIISNVTEEVNSIQYNDTPRFFAENQVKETIEYTFTDGTVQYNGTDINGYTAEQGNTPIAFSDAFCLFYSVDGSQNASIILILSDSTKYDLTKFILNTDGTYSYTNSSGTNTGTYNVIVNADPNGEYAAIETTSTVSAHVDTGKTAYIFKRAYNQTTSNAYIAASITNGTVANIFNNPGNGSTISIPAPEVTAERLNDLITIDNKVIIDDIEYDSRSLLIVPYEYHAVTASDDAIISMINIVPLLMIVGIIIAVVAMFIRTR